MVFTAVIPKSSPDLCLPKHAYKVVGLHGIFTVPLQREKIQLSQFTCEEVRLGEVQVQHSPSFGLVWDCEMTQNDSNLSLFKDQQPPKLHVLSALSFYIASLQCWVWRRDAKNK